MIWYDGSEKILIIYVLKLLGKFTIIIIIIIKPTLINEIKIKVEI